jgi:drug/metabolite transporter (DMT)-like permease
MAATFAVEAIEAGKGVEAQPMLTTVVLLVAFLAIGFFARKDSRRTQLLMLGTVVLGVILLMRGK